MKKEITKASIQLFEQKGFSQTSIQDIVESLNVTKGTFYYYFTSKEQLLMDIHNQYIDNLLTQQKKIIDNSSFTNREKIKKIIALLIRDIRDEKSSGKVFFREIVHLNSENVGTIKEKRNRFRINIEDIVRKGIDNKEFKTNLRPDMVAFGILGVTNYSYNWYNPEGEVTPEELTNIFSVIVLEGLLDE